VSVATDVWFDAKFTMFNSRIFLLPTSIGIKYNAKSFTEESLLDIT